MNNKREHFKSALQRSIPIIVGVALAVGALAQAQAAFAVPTSGICINLPDGTKVCVGASGTGTPVTGGTTGAAGAGGTAGAGGAAGIGTNGAGGSGGAGGTATGGAGGGVCIGGVCSAPGSGQTGGGSGVR